MKYLVNISVEVAYMFENSKSSKVSKSSKAMLPCSTLEMTDCEMTPVQLHRTKAASY